MKYIKSLVMKQENYNTVFNSLFSFLQHPKTIDPKFSPIYCWEKEKLNLNHRLRNTYLVLILVSKSLQNSNSCSLYFSLENKKGVRLWSCNLSSVFTESQNSKRFEGTSGGYLVQPTCSSRILKSDERIWWQHFGSLYCNTAKHYKAMFFNF